MKSKLIVLLALFILAACSKVPAGYQGIIVNLYGSEKGVSEKPVGIGKYWLGWNEELFIFPTFLQNYTWVKGAREREDESITMQTSEGLSINTDAGITYQITPDNVVKVFQKYRQGIEEITNTFLRNMVRDAMNQTASTMTIEQLYGAHKEAFMTEVNELVKKQAIASGINVDKIYLIGTFRLPPTVEASINAKIQATQNAMMIENQVAAAQAEAKKLLIKATAEAQANELVAKSTTSQYLQYVAIQRWDGKLPQVTSGATPFVKLHD
jgi:regulator of protease activity HflC (stomatin/prohibitin superfamily)